MRMFQSALVVATLLVSACGGDGYDYGEPDNPADDNGDDYAHAMSVFLGEHLQAGLDNDEPQCVAEVVVGTMADSRLRQAGLSAEDFEELPVLYSEVGRTFDTAARQNVVAGIERCVQDRCEGARTEFAEALVELVFASRSADEAEQMPELSKRLASIC